MLFHTDDRIVDTGFSAYFETYKPAADCDTPSPPPNGSMEHLHRQLNFDCEAGYQLVGSETLICQENGEWNGSIPQCKRR